MLYVTTSMIYYVALHSTAAKRRAGSEPHRRLGSLPHAAQQAAPTYC